MTKKVKETKVFLISGIASAALAIIAFFLKVSVNSQLQSVEDGYAQIIIMGSKQLSRSEFISEAGQAISVYNVLTIIFLVAAAILFALYFRAKKNKSLTASGAADDVTVG